MTEEKAKEILRQFLELEFSGPASGFQCQECGFGQKREEEALRVLLGEDPS